MSIGWIASGRTGMPIMTLVATSMKFTLKVFEMNGKEREARRLSSMTFTTALGLMLCQHHVDLGLSWGFGIQTAYERYDLWPLLGWIGAHLFVFLVYQGTMRLGAKRLEAMLSHDVQVEG